LNSHDFGLEVLHSKTRIDNDKCYFLNFFFGTLSTCIIDFILHEINKVSPTISFGTSEDHSFESLSILGINWSNQIHKFSLSSFNIFDTFNIKISSSKIILSDLSLLCEEVKVHCFDGQFHNGFGLHLFIFLIHDLFVSC
jgi:hypothetical protein